MYTPKQPSLKVKIQSREITVENDINLTIYIPKQLIPKINAYHAYTKFQKLLVIDQIKRGHGQMDTQTTDGHTDHGWTHRPRMDTQTTDGHTDHGWTHRPRMDTQTTDGHTDHIWTHRPRMDTQTTDGHTDHGRINLHVALHRLNVVWYDTVVIYNATPTNSGCQPMKREDMMCGL